MDPATLATAVTAFLLPFLSKFGENIANEAQKKLPDEVSKLWGAIVSRFKDKPAAQGSLNDLKTKADDADNQEAFSLQLRKALKDDPAFAAEIEKLLQTAQATVAVSNTGSGAVATQGSVSAGEKGIAIGGNVGGIVVMGNGNVVNRDARDSDADSPEKKVN